MPANNPDSGINDSGFLRSLSESFRSHIDARLKSPFAGAFVLAWIATNWRALSIFALSNQPIEARVDHVSSLFNAATVLWKPLGIAIIFTLAFYFFSLLFLVLYEVYAFGQRWVEKRFDRVRWVSPRTYIELKSKNIATVRDLTELASDNMSDINAARQAAIDSQERALAIESELADTKAHLQNALEQVRVATEAARGATSEIDKTNRELEASRAFARSLEGLVRSFVKDANPRTVMGAEIEGNLGLTRPPIEADEGTQRTLLAMQSSMNREIPSELLDSKLDARSVAAYTLLRFPLLPINERLQSKMLDDIRSSGLEQDISTIRRLDEVVDIGWNEIMKFSLENPNIFRFGTDFLTKSIGLLSKEFREQHGFSAATKARLSRAAR